MRIEKVTSQRKWNVVTRERKGTRCFNFREIKKIEGAYNIWPSRNYKKLIKKYIFDVIQTSLLFFVLLNWQIFALFEGNNSLHCDIILSVYLTVYLHVNCTKQNVWISDAFFSISTVTLCHFQTITQRFLFVFSYFRIKSFL